MRHDGNQNAENCKQKEQYYSSSEDHCNFPIPGGKIQVEAVMLYLSGIGGVLFIMVISLCIWRIGATATDSVSRRVSCNKSEIPQLAENIIF